MIRWLRNKVRWLRNKVRCALGRHEWCTYSQPIAGTYDCVLFTQCVYCDAEHGDSE